MEKYLFLYLCGINLLTFIIYGIDKKQSKRRGARVPEVDLFILAAVGGSLGALFGMYYFHHKTHKKRFKIGIPMLLIFHVALLAGLIFLGVLKFEMATGRIF